MSIPPGQRGLHEEGGDLGQALPGAANWLAAGW